MERESAWFSCGAFQVGQKRRQTTRRCDITACSEQRYSTARMRPFPAWPTPAEPGITAQQHHSDTVPRRTDCQGRFQPLHDGIDMKSILAASRRCLTKEGSGNALVYGVFCIDLPFYLPGAVNGPEAELGLTRCQSCAAKSGHCKYASTNPATLSFPVIDA